MIRLSAPGTLLYRDVVLRVVASSCRLVRSGLTGEQEAGHREPDPRFDAKVVSAVGEAFNNVAIHGYANRQPGSVELEIELTSDRITIRLSDTGESFDPTHVPAPDLASLPESHMGLFIERSLMDEVTYRPGSPPGAPNVLTLTKRYRGGRGDPPGEGTGSG